MGPKYAKIMNVTKFLIWQGSQHACVTQRFEYARISLDRVLNISRVLNVPGSEYGRVLNMQDLHRVLDMPQYGCMCLKSMAEYEYG